MTVDQWMRVLARECKCDVPHIVPIDDLTNSEECQTCGGWIALHVGAAGDMVKMAERYKVAP